MDKKNHICGDCDNARVIFGDDFCDKKLDYVDGPCDDKTIGGKKNVEIEQSKTGRL